VAPKVENTNVANHWIAESHIKKGGLHRSLGVPMGKKIPKSKLNKAAKRAGKVGKQARLAETFAKMRKG
jgi:hypothetical protein